MTKTYNNSPPMFSKEQIDYLNNLYPERSPDPKQTDREIWIAVGSRQVVRHLNSVFERQLETAIIQKR